MDSAKQDLTMQQADIIQRLDGHTEGFLYSVQNLLHLNDVQHGFWDEPTYKMTLKDQVRSLDKGSLADTVPDFNDSEKLMLMVSELAEAQECLRAGTADEPSAKIAPFTNLEEELADTVIRILDYAGKKNLRLAEAIVAKAEYNIRRPYKHGKKF